MVRRWIVLALGCTAVLVGCGGDEDSTPESAETRTASPETTAGWTRRVNASCRQGNAEAVRIVAQVRREQVGALDFTAESVERTVPALRRGLRRLRAIEAPSSLRSGYRRFIGDLEDGVTLYEQFGQAVRSGREARVRPFASRFEAIAARTRPFAIEHGLTDCLNRTG